MSTMLSGCRRRVGMSGARIRIGSLQGGARRKSLGNFRVRRDIPERFESSRVIPAEFRCVGRPERQLPGKIGHASGMACQHARMLSGGVDSFSGIRFEIHERMQAISSAPVALEATLAVGLVVAFGGEVLAGFEVLRSGFVDPASLQHQPVHVITAKRRNGLSEGFRRAFRSDRTAARCSDRVASRSARRSSRWSADAARIRRSGSHSSCNRLRLRAEES
jgi:hypothetical protein